ncbi:MAG: chemotaxis protein CheW [SAR324 cluster bacterium]|uniref:Chemotaxis protein CheW n=1 Tax=SAR324 cluster bacterium TaxID=2024889 RepID=A0A2A4T386_9DELT|nr:MAG: chemotaxis protein CheW [SAR324 cluster bacterium]
MAEATTHFLTFRLGEEIYALEILKVREVLDYGHITKVPGTPPFMLGVINLRGHVVPIVDMKIKFDFPQVERTVNTCIIIIEIEMEGEMNVLGALADSVDEVIELSANEIEPSPKIGTHLKTDFLKGMGKHEDHFILLLDIEHIFSIEELTDVKGSQVAATLEQKVEMDEELS